MKLTSILLNNRILFEYINLGDKSYVTYSSFNSSGFTERCNSKLTTKVLEYYILKNILNQYPNCKVESVEINLESTPLYNYIQLINSAKGV
jgi:hypothetical protein